MRNDTTNNGIDIGAESKYRIVSNNLELVGSKGTKVFKIHSVEPSGINIEDYADNGVDIVTFVSFDRIG